MASEILCTKHNKPVAYICTLYKCPQSHLICEACKQLEAQHISTHFNFILNYEQFFKYRSSKSTGDFIPKLEKALADCEGELLRNKQFSAAQTKSVNEDFERLRAIFLEVESKCRASVMASCTNDIERCNERVLQLRNQLRQFSQEGESQRGFFSLFTNTEEIQAANTYALIEKILEKNKNAFKLRADLLDFNNEIKKLPERVPRYKESDRAKERFNEMRSNFEKDMKRTYGQFTELFNEEELRKSLVMEMRKSTVSNNQLSQSQASSTSSNSNKKASVAGERNETPPNLSLTTFPTLHPQIQAFLAALEPIPSSTGFKDQGPYQYKDGIYYGNFSKGMRHGKGIFLFNDGTYYDGYWMNDGMYSMGRIITKNYFYEGEVREGKANGRGRMVEADREYDGQWVNDLKQGQGRLQYKNGKLRYVGSFQNNMFHGNGVLETEESRYEGAFWAGERSGEGTLRMANGETFKGKFRNGMKLFGKYTYPNGSYYEGSFENDLPHGNGVFVWEDGVRYQGTWVRGEQQGIGKEIYPDKQERRGEWHAGEWKRWL